MAVANSRMTVASILAAVQTTANTATGALNAVNSAVGMANKFVEDAAYRQEKRSKADKQDFVEALILEKSQQRTESRLQAEEFCKQSARHAQLYQEAHDEIAALLRD